MAIFVKKIMLMKTKILTTFFAFLCLFGSIKAQRTMQGQNMAGVSINHNFPDIGFSLAYGGYTMTGLWAIQASTDLYSQYLSAEKNKRLQYCHIAVSGYYMTSFFRTRSRNFNLYGGGGALLGYEIIDPLKRTPKEVEVSLEDGYFIYGVFAKIETELFISRRTAFTITAETPINFSSPLDRIHYKAGIGIRIML